ncbi:PC-Esterase protein [Dioscorea alata]|uniref:PC-Esterase protein n=1 Tax=Dioscorea alata TaxID=55571 RepID=A0ACB7U771_DIOAL|nr:PC-Esterase protein [Dioscorea alata]
MIQEHQNCMKNGRPDMDFLKWRWKPDDCELLRFAPKKFLEIFRGKSLAFVGDSLARNQMQSLMCLLSKVEYPKDVSNSSDESFRRMYYKTYNFTVSIFWSPYLVKAEEPKSEGSMIDRMWKLYLDEVDENWASKIDEFDYVIISDGTWFTRPLLFYEQKRITKCQYCEIENVELVALNYFHRMAFRTALQAINKLDKYKGVTIVRTISPPHFEDGEWDNGGDCVRTRPFGRNETELLEGMPRCIETKLKSLRERGWKG